MAYTELNRLNYSAGRVNIEEVYITGPLNALDVIKTRLSNVKYASIKVAPKTDAAFTITNHPSGLMIGRELWLGSADLTDTAYLVRFVGE